MKRIILSVLCAVALAGSAFGGVRVQTITTSSLANAAIDTVVVDVSDIAWFDNGGAATIHFALANMEAATADSVSIGVDLGESFPNIEGAGSSGDGSWTQVYAQGIAATSIASNSVANLTSATFEGSDLRLRIKNVSGAAEAYTIRIVYPTVQE